jgi:hypothetical protein
MTVRQSTGYSAYFLLHGTDPVLQFDLWEMTCLIEGFNQGFTSEDLLALCIQQIHANIETHSLHPNTNLRNGIETRLVQGSYSPEDIVLVRNTAIEKELNRKMKPRYLVLQTYLNFPRFLPIFPDFLEQLSHLAPIY